MKRVSLILLFLFSCSPKNVKMGEMCHTIERGAVVVLPFTNNSNDLTAEELLRDLVIERFRRKGWVVIDKNIVDERLRSVGITDGGQLGTITSQELIKMFETRYLAYGTIEEFKFQNIGFVITKKVELNLKIYDGNKNEYVFDDTQSASDTKVYLSKDEAKKAFIRYNAEKLVENIAKRPLYNISVECVDKIFRKF